MDQLQKDPLQLLNRAIGRYQIRRYLGGGAMGRVYGGFDETLQRDVAIKFMPSDLAASPDLTERFLREAQILARLHHTNIIDVYDYGVTDAGLPYIVMRYLSKGSLADVFNRIGEPISLQDMLLVIEPIAHALHHAHLHGVIHRDVKPANILFDETRQAFLADFGISKLLDNSNTATSGHIGTPAYMAPELWTGGPVTGSVDQYALAVVVWLMLTRRGPFDASTTSQMMYQHLQVPPPNLHEFRKNVSPQVSAVVTRALSKQAKDRYPSLLDFANALRAAIEGKPTPLPVALRAPSPVPPEVPTAGGGQLWAGVLAVIVVALISGGFWLFSTERLSFVNGITPTAIAVVPSTTTTRRPSSTPNVTRTAQPTDTPTGIPTDIPTHTPIPQVTPTASAFLDPSRRLFRDDFDAARLSDSWQAWGTGTRTLEDGLFTFTSSSGDYPAVARPVTRNSGVLALFKQESGAAQIYLDYGDWASPAYRRFGFSNFGDGWQANFNSGTTFATLQYINTLQRNEWYYVLMTVQDGTHFNLRVWEPGASGYSANYLFEPTREGWDQATWKYVVGVDQGTLQLDWVEGFTLPDDYTLPEQPPTLLNP
ncbi:MAG: serine/threonine protein kinase [Phototrophicaceae bacterium]